MKTETTKSEVEEIARGMSDDQIRYQVAAHERQGDYSMTFHVYVDEYRKRELTSTGYRDESEVAMGA